MDVPCHHGHHSEGFSIIWLLGPKVFVHMLPTHDELLALELSPAYNHNEEARYSSQNEKKTDFIPIKYKREIKSQHRGIKESYISKWNKGPLLQ